MLTKAEVKRCLRGEPTPIVPAYLFWLDSKFIAQHPEDVRRMRETFEDDFIFTYPRLIKRCHTADIRPGEFTDDWGSLFVSAPDGVGDHPARPIIHTLEDWEAYVGRGMPGIDPALYASDTVEKKDAERYVVLSVWRTFYERMYMLMGMEALWMEIALEEELFLRMLEDLRDFTIRCIEQAARAGADAVFLADDWGMQDRLQISPDAFRKHFKPAYGAMIETAHGLGLDVWMHSCGNITSIIGDFIDIRLDVLGQLQAGALDLEAIGKAYGGEITFFGGIDVQHNLVHGDRASIRAEVAVLMRIFSAEKGRYMICPSNTIMPETPVENVWHLFEAIREYGDFR